MQGVVWVHTPTEWLLSSQSASDGKEPNSAKQIGPQGISRIRAKHNWEFIFCSFSDNILGFLCWKMLPALSSFCWRDVFLFWPSRWFNARLAIRWQMWPLRRCIKADHNPASWHWHCLSIECSGPVWFGTAGSTVCTTVYILWSPPYVDNRKISPQLCSSPPAIGARTRTPVPYNIWQSVSCKYPCRMNEKLNIGLQFCFLHFTQICRTRYLHLAQ